jgi:CBS domain-containing protein/Zn-dependent protease
MPALHPLPAHAPLSHGRQRSRPLFPARRFAADVHPSSLPACALLVLTFAVGVFPRAAPGRSVATYIAMALAVTALYAASVLAHAVAHAVVARRELGARLWLLGDIAPPTVAPLSVDLAGPVVSAALGGALLALGGVVAWPAEIGQVLTWAGWLNLALLACNLLPAVPLDGGRVLRTWLWQRLGDFVDAARIAARVSRALALGLGCAAIVGLVLGHLAALWLAAIAALVLSAGQTEWFNLRVQHLLEDLEVGDVMLRELASVDVESSAQEIVDVAERAGVEVVPVLSVDGEPAGFASLSLIRAIPAHRRPWVRAHELMNGSAAHPLVLDADIDLVTAAEALLENPLRSAFVLRDGSLVGMLTLDDVVRAVRTATLVSR